MSRLGFNSIQLLGHLRADPEPRFSIRPRVAMIGQGRNNVPVRPFQRMTCRSKSGIWFCARGG